MFKSLSRIDFWGRMLILRRRRTCSLKHLCEEVREEILLPCFWRKNFLSKFARDLKGEVTLQHSHLFSNPRWSCCCQGASFSIIMITDLRLLKKRQVISTRMQDDHLVSCLLSFFDASSSRQQNSLDRIFAQFISKRRSISFTSWFTLSLSLSYCKHLRFIWCPTDCFIAKQQLWQRGGPFIQFQKWTSQDDIRVERELFCPKKPHVNKVHD